MIFKRAGLLKTVYVYAFLTGAGRKSIFMRFVFSKFDIINKQNNLENLWNVVMQAEIEDAMICR